MHQDHQAHSLSESQFVTHVDSRTDCSSNCLPVEAAVLCCRMMKVLLVEAFGQKSSFPGGRTSRENHLSKDYHFLIFH
jgi:hypothetical protein